MVSSAQKKGKGKVKDKKQPVRTEYISSGDETPKLDTVNRFTGIIKYRMTTDDPSDRDSMYIIFGENKIRVTLFHPGYKEGQIFEDNFLVNFLDSGLYVMDIRNKTYRLEKLGVRNTGAEINIENDKKTSLIGGVLCNEYKGEMTIKEDSFEAAALLSTKHSYEYAVDYDFLNIQPVVKGYRIVLGWRTKTSDNENTYIVAYQVVRGDVSPYFDLAGYRQQ
jgi:hypothetical protein